MSYYGKQNQPRRPQRYKDKPDQRWGGATHSRSSSLSSDDFGFPPTPPKQPRLPSIFESPRFKRILLLATVLFLISVAAYTQIYLPRKIARLAEEAAQQVAMDGEAEDVAVEQSARAGPAIGDQLAHKPVDLGDLVLLKEMDETHKPTTGKKGKGEKDKGDGEDSGRLILIGDVHGMKSELVRLLKKVEFDRKKGDHLIFTGDMISKGPDSTGVVDLAMEMGADAVRGNHEDRMLLAYDALSRENVNTLAPSTVATDPDQREVDLEAMPVFTHNGEYKDRLLARQFNREQIKWLRSLPIILKVGVLEGMGEVLVVHGGLVPGLKLDRQDPYSVMNMRTIDLKTHIPSDVRVGTVWTKLWNAYQRLQPESKRSTVIYGHDSHRGLQIAAYSKGLDSSCLKGGELTALVIESGKDEVKQSLVHVKCKNKSP